MSDIIYLIIYLFFGLVFCNMVVMQGTKYKLAKSLKDSDINVNIKVDGFERKTEKVEIKPEEPEEKQNNLDEKELKQRAELARDGLQSLGINKTKCEKLIDKAFEKIGDDKMPRVDELIETALKNK